MKPRSLYSKSRENYFSSETGLNVFGRNSFALEGKGWLSIQSMLQSIEFYNVTVYRNCVKVNNVFY